MQTLRRGGVGGVGGAGANGGTGGISGVGLRRALIIVVLPLAVLLLLVRVLRIRTSERFGPMVPFERSCHVHGWGNDRKQGAPLKALWPNWRLGTLQRFSAACGASAPAGLHNRGQVNVRAPSSHQSSRYASMISTVVFRSL